jgi:hypothetical protein
MDTQTPAQGILKRNDWGDAMSYQVVCECSDPNCSHDLWIEADESGVNVTVYVTTKTRWWDLNRFQIIWKLLTKGYIEYQASLILPRQVALNYATTLTKAIDDVTKFREEKTKSVP